MAVLLPTPLPGPRMRRENGRRAVRGGRGEKTPSPEVSGKVSRALDEVMLDSVFPETEHYGI